MIARADSEITLSCSPAEFNKLFQKELEWPNPEYVKRLEAGRSLWGVPRDIVLWKRKGEDFILPFGVLKALWAQGVKVVPSDHLLSHERRFWATVGNLYDYQTEALNAALKAKNGVLVAPCGSGKTQIGIAICANLGLNTLWLTHTQELLRQSMDRAKQYLSIPMGTITGGKINAVTGITFATVQTMSKIDLTGFKDFWDVIIVDECHRCVGTPTAVSMFWKVLSSLSARVKIGLTATPKRSDGMEKAMYALLGPKIYEITRDQVKLNTCRLCVIEPIKTGWTPDMDKCLNPDGTLNYAALITDCIENPVRNGVISNAIGCAVTNGDSALVLSERIEHLRLLSELCPYPSGILSTAKKSERQSLLKELSNGRIKVLFATYAIAKEGLDIPSLKNLFMASPVKDEITVTQSAGRVMRKAPWKDYGYIWDFDDNMHMLQGWLKKRMKIYEKINK